MDHLLQHLVERHVDTDRVALRHHGEDLSYTSLWTRAASLANALVADGLAPGDRVGILARKGFESAVALYGIMMAGGVYVPLDPFAPVSRTDFVIRDCGIERLVTTDAQARTIGRMASTEAALAAIFGLDDEQLGDACSSQARRLRCIPWSAIEAMPRTAPSLRTTEDDLCYVLYTSGSTGTPKGIMHTHRSARAWAKVAASVHGLGPTDVISNYAPLHFDLSTLDYFAGAHAGSTTVVIPEETTKFPSSLATLLADDGLTVFYTVPMALVQLAQPGVLDGRDMSRLRLVLFGGEPMPVKHLRTLMNCLRGVSFVNVYGPTETNGCTYFEVPADIGSDVESLPIGGPYPNVEAIVVDAENVPVADGDAGELLVRAPTMMRGYWGRPDLNADAFFERDRFGGLADVFHHTGDIVERRADGGFDFLGRRDRRIKSRGCRVDLDEVEAVLVAHGEVHEAAVYAVPDDDGALEIHAEVIAVDTIEDAVLLRTMRTALPSYAVPCTIVARESFPRTSTGKIDRRSMAAGRAIELGRAG